MANGKTHKAIGAGIGTVASLIYNGQKGNPDLSFIYAMGGLIGGTAGGGLADIIDPPDSPFHRSLGHSVCVNGSVYFSKRVRRILQDCLDWLLKKAMELMNAGKKFLSGLCHFVAAFLIGFAAGHGSHLITDMFTPMRLPIFV
jgi:uncharacterized membrane protein YfcA